MEGELGDSEQPEQIQTRTETSRSLEDAPRFRALDTLTRLGLLIPLSQMELFHGRVAEKDKETTPWTVIPNFANGGNDSGNHNVYDRPVLYTAERKTANDFAIERLKEKAGPAYFGSQVREYTPEERKAWLERINDNGLRDFFEKGKKYTDEELQTYTDLINSEAGILASAATAEAVQDMQEASSSTHEVQLQRIVSPNTDALIIDKNFQVSALGEEDIKEYYKALGIIALRATEGSPVDFEDKAAPSLFAAEYKKSYKGYLTRDQIQEIAKSTGISEKAALQIGSALNMRMVAINPVYLARKILEYPSKIYNDTFEIEGKKIEIPLNLEYAEEYMRQAHIVGVKDKVYSATIYRNIEPIMFFDFDKIGTQAQLENQRHEMTKKMGGLKDQLPILPNPETSGQAKDLFEILRDIHAKPESIVEAAKLIGEYKKTFDSDAGNWEGFTLGEHTETVLRNFDENFADILPFEYIEPLRLALLVHDIGKPLAVARGEKDRQKEYNRVIAKEFLNNIGISSNASELIISIITDGSDLAFKLQKRPNEEISRAMDMYAEDVLKKYLNTDSVTSAQRLSFIEMCKILQLCDGGAYTSMAITRDSVLGQYRNAPSFNSSFETLKDLGGRGIRYKNN